MRQHIGPRPARIPNGATLTGHVAVAVSERDRLMLEMLAAGATPAAIADRLGTTEGWVWARRDALCGRLDVTTTSELLALAICSGVVR
jgi:DNA-binding CsgD family transcriptional regulator